MLPDEEALYTALRLVLTERADLVPWSSFGPEHYERLLTIAREEGVAPLLYWSLRESGCLDHWPEDLQWGLARRHYATAAHNTLIYQELERIASAFQDELSADDQALTADGRLPIVVLKGAALASTVYPSVALRPLSDLDLLVPRAFMEAAMRAMRSLGYEERIPEVSPGINRLIGHHVRLLGGPQENVVVELHWNLVAGDADWRTPPLDWFWAQVEPLSVDGEALGAECVGERDAARVCLYMLTPTAHLLYLSAHLMLQHGGAQAYLLWLYDLHLLVSRCGERLDWDLLAQQARAFQWTAALRAALQRMSESYGTPLPEGFLDRLAEDQEADSEYLVRRKASSLQTRATRLWANLFSLDRRARWRLIRGVLWPDPTFMRWRYRPRPDWLWPLYYPYRWFDIAREGLVTLHKMIRPSR
ncbi:MAG: nucleotidyltransferase family protein [Chloroflexi bacterium]|nr:nucleotidyltransferase family protein [Chloroflexota bacterium]